MAYNMKGSPFQRNFGIGSPVKKEEERKRPISDFLSKTIKNINPVNIKRRNKKRREKKVIEDITKKYEANLKKGKNKPVDKSSQEEVLNISRSLPSASSELVKKIK